MKDRLRRLKGRVQDGLENFRTKSDQSVLLSAEDQVPSDRTKADSQQTDTRVPRQDDRAEGVTSPGEASNSLPQSNTNKDAPKTSTIESIDVSTWTKIYSEAYETVKADPEHSELLQKLERFLDSEGEDVDVDNADANELPTTIEDIGRTKRIQKVAEEKLNNVSEAHLAFNIRNRPIVVRESILKAVQVINTLKPIISGAVAAEPSAALAWAGVTTVLPILESIFQQDEDAATGLVNITFLMARYQAFHEPDFISQLLSLSQSDASQKVLSGVKDELVSLYGKIYIYEARIILQYGLRKKVHRVLRNAVKADDWKQLWSDIESMSNHIDKGVTAEVNVTTLRAWKVVKDIQERTERVESLQHETLAAVQDFDRRQLMQSLEVTGNAVFDSRRTSKAEAFCLPGTQRHILQTIQDWTDDPNGKMIFLLEGMAGTGKTSIALTVASCLDTKVPFTDPTKQPSKAFLGASFFFAQGDATRNNIAEFFRSTAWCLADVLPDVRALVAKAIKDNPGIHTKASQQQLQKLIINPLELLDRKTFIPLQLVVVIDALDECIDEDAEDLLGMLANLDNLHQIQLRIFITSRREGHISTAMKNLPSRLYQTTRLNKIESSPGNNNDIVFYLSKSLDRIATRWRVTDGGVSDDDINKLADKADGLFIYAATACRFLDSRHFVNKGFRERRLNLFFKDQWETEGPQHTIDEIYHKVLTFPETEGWSQKEKIPFYSGISQLIGFIVVLFRPASVETLSHLLPTTATEKTTREDLDYYLGELHSIIDVPEDPTFPLSLVHLSFRDFILDQKRSERLPFAIDELAMHREVLRRCFELMNLELRQDICCLSLPGSLISDVPPGHIASHIPRYLQYSCRYWVDHLMKANPKLLTHNASENVEYHTSASIVYRFLKEKLLYWLEVMTFIGEASSIVPIFSQLENSIEPPGNPDLSSLLHDAKRFVLNNRWIIEHTPLQMYCSALLFCPKESLVRSYYQKMIPAWITKKPQTQQTWPAGVLTLEGHTGYILGTAFSPTEALLASVSRDNTTRVWDYNTGSEKYRFEDPGTPVKVCFSADGSKLASVCLDGTVRVRDHRKGTQVSFHAASNVRQILFSPTSCNILASILDDSMLYVWNVEDKRQVAALQLPDRGFRKHVAFSPDGLLVAICLDRFAALYDVELKQLLHEFKPHERLIASDLEQIRGLSISADHRIVAVRFDKSVDFWEMAPLNPTLVRTYKATWSDNSSFLFMSADENLKFCQSHTGMVDVSDAATENSIGTFLKSVIKRDIHGRSLRADTLSYQSLIRILSGPSTSTSSGGENGTPENVELLFGNIALSYFSGMETKQWNVIDGSMDTFEGIVQAATLSPDRTFVLLQLNGGDEFQVWDNTLTQKIAAYEKMAYMSFVPQTGHLVSLSLSGNVQIRCHDPKSLTFDTVDNFSLPSLRFNRIRKINGWGAKPLYVSPDGEVIAVVIGCDFAVLDDNTDLLQLWNIPRQEKVKEIRHQHFRQIVFSPDNRYVGVEYAYPKSTELFDISNATEVEGRYFDNARLITFHPSGRMFGIVSERHNTILVFKGTPWEADSVLQAPKLFRVESLAFSTSNKLVALSRESRDRRSIIDVWDTATMQKIGSQKLTLNWAACSLCFSTNEKFLESNRGRLPVPMQDAADMVAESPGDGIHNCLYVLDDWVYQGRERLIWLPPSFRPPTYPARNIDVKGDTIAIACKGNSVKFIAVSLEETPVAMYYLATRSR